MRGQTTQCGLPASSMLSVFVGSQPVDAMSWLRFQTHNWGGNRVFWFGTPGLECANLHRPLSCWSCRRPLYASTLHGLMAFVTPVLCLQPNLPPPLSSLSATSGTSPICYCSAGVRVCKATACVGYHSSWPGKIAVVSSQLAADG